MKILFVSIVLTALAALPFSPANAGSVNGYYRSNGTYVQPYQRSAPDNTVTNNYSYQGNVNPSTGVVGTQRYTHDTTSPFYNGTPDANGITGHDNNSNVSNDSDNQ